MTLESREANEKRQNENWGNKQHTKYKIPSPHETRTMTTKIWPCTTNANYSASYDKDVKVEGECMDRDMGGRRRDDDLRVYYGDVDPCKALLIAEDTINYRLS